MTPRRLNVSHGDRASAHRLAGALSELVHPAPEAVTIFEDGPGWRIEAYFEAAPDDEPRYITELADLSDARPQSHVWENVPDLNWVAMSQAALPPVEAGRFTVHGTHDRGRVPGGPWSIEIDAGEAFGTAHHATTYGCLLALHRLAGAAKPPVRILDLGTGSGVLAIAAHRLWRRADVIASDIDTDAVRVAAANVANNGARSQLSCRLVDGVPGGNISGLDYDLVIANILAGPLIAMSASIARAVTPGGHLVLSGILNPQAPAVLAAYRRHGMALVRHDRIEGWSTLSMRKRRR